MNKHFTLVDGLAHNMKTNRRFPYKKIEIATVWEMFCQYGNQTHNFNIRSPKLHVNQTDT